MKTKSRPPSSASRRRGYRRRKDGFGSPTREAARLVLLGGLFLSLVAFRLGAADPFNMTKLTILWVSGLVAFGLWSVDIIRGEEPLPRLWLAVAAVGFLVAFGVATVSSVSPGASVFGTHTRYGGLLSYLLYGLIFLLLADLYRRRPQRLHGVVVLLVTAVVILAGYVIIQAAGLDPVPWRDPHGRPIPYPVGTLGNSNFNGALLAMGLPGVGYLFFTATSREGRTFFMGLGALVGAALWFSQSRGGMLAALVGMAVFALILRHRFPRWMRGLFVVGVVAALVLGGILASRAGLDRALGPLGGLDILRERTVAQRMETWRAANEIFRDNPVLGTGPETFYEVYPQYRSAADARRSGLMITDKPHNLLLEFAAGMGAVGLGAFLLLVGLAFVFGLWRFRKLNEPQRLLLGTFLAILVAYLVQSSFSIDVPPLAIVGWLSLAAIAALADPGAQKGLQAPQAAQAPVKRRHQAFTVPAIALVGLVILALLVVGVRPYAADRRAGLAKEAIAAEGGRELVAMHYRRAMEFHPYEPSHASNLGVYFDEQGTQSEDGAEKAELFAEALELFRTALDLRPGNVVYMSNVALAQTRLADLGEEDRFHDARLWLDRALEQDPHNWLLHHRYGQMLAMQANEPQDVPLFCQAQRWLRQARRLGPGEEGVRNDLEQVQRAIEAYSRGEGCP